MKLITATAALEGGLITPDTVQFDGGSLKVGGVTFKNAGGAVNGALALRQALTVSSDVFFYQARPRGQRPRRRPVAPEVGPPAGPWAQDRHRPAGRDARPRAQPEVAQPAVQEAPHRPPLERRATTSTSRSARATCRPTPPAGGGLRDDRQRRPGAQAAAGRADRAARRPRAPAAPALRPRASSTSTRRSARRSSTGLRGAASQPGGTSAKVFNGFAIPVAGKTGTAQKGAGRPTSPGTWRSRPTRASSTWWP